MYKFDPQETTRTSVLQTKRKNVSGLQAKVKMFLDQNEHASSSNLKSNVSKIQWLAIWQKILEWLAIRSLKDSSTKKFQSQYVFTLHFNYQWARFKSLHWHCQLLLVTRVFQKIWQQHLLCDHPTPLLPCMQAIPQNFKNLVPMSPIKKSN